jgi:hypothetical protein
LIDEIYSMGDLTFDEFYLTSIGEMPSTLTMKYEGNYDDFMAKD